MSEKPVVASVSALITGYDRSGAKVDDARTDSSVDSRVKLKDGTIEQIIEEVLKNATKDEERSASVIRSAMNEATRQGATNQRISYFANDIPVEKTNPISRYLKDGAIPVGGKDYPASMVDIRIDKTYWMG